MTDVQDIQRRLIELDVEHRDLDAVIDMLTLAGEARVAVRPHADGRGVRARKGGAP